MASPSVQIHIPTPARVAWLLRVALVTAAAVGAVLLAVSSAPTVSEALTELRAGVAARPADPSAAKPLPREWRWEPKAVDYGSMFRSGQRKPDPWIRNGG